MDFDEVFDDLEAQFESIGNHKEGLSNISSFSQCRFVEITTLQNTRMRVLAPILGSNFVAGIDENLPNWIIWPLNRIVELRFEESSDLQYPILRKREISLADFIKQLPNPCDLLLEINEQTTQELFRGSTSELIFLQARESVRAVPVAAITKMVVVDNSGGFVEQLANC